MTLIPVVAIKLTGPENEGEEFLLSRAGFRGVECILLGKLTGGEFKYNPYSWRDRTYETIHKYLINHFDEHESGDVLDAEFLLGESDQPKLSERL